MAGRNDALNALCTQYHLSCVTMASPHESILAQSRAREDALARGSRARRGTGYMRMMR